MSEMARDLGRRWFEEVWNRKRREAIPEMMTPDCVIHDGEVDSSGPDAFYPLFDLIHGSFSEIHVAVEHTISEGDAACIRWSFTGKHTGGAMGLPPTGKAVHVTGITILRADGGRVIEAWQNWDMLGMMQQIQSDAKTAATYIGAS